MGCDVKGVGLGPKSKIFLLSVHPYSVVILLPRYTVMRGILYFQLKLFFYPLSGVRSVRFEGACLSFNKTVPLKRDWSLDAQVHSSAEQERTGLDKKKKENKQKKKT